MRLRRERTRRHLGEGGNRGICIPRGGYRGLGLVGDRGCVLMGRRAREFEGNGLGGT